MLEVGSAYGQITIDTRGAHSNVLGLNSLLGGLGNTFLTLNPLTIGLAAAFGTVAGAAYGMSSAISSSVDLAADLEEQLDGIQALSGASATEMSQLQATIEELGLNPNLKVSALEAAQAVEMLVRNGLELEDIMAGAAEGTVLLANATGAEFGRAADIATDVMALFGIDAENMIDAVNGITSVVTNSKFDINDYALALAQGGGVAAAAGVSFEDFNATIAAISPYFSSGSDAGTSFKVFLQRLIPQSKKATALMKELGIITEDGTNRFFDAGGNMKSMAEIADILNQAISGLSDAQRNEALSTIFGTDAMRAAAALSQMTAEEFRDLQAAMGETDAIEAARVRMDNLRGDLEIFGGVIETLKWQIGDEWIPVLRELVQWFTELATIYGPKAVEFFGELASIVQQTIPYFQDLANRGIGYMAQMWDDVMAGFETGGIMGALAAIGDHLGQGWTQHIWPALSDWASRFWQWITGDSGVEAGMSENLNNLLARISTYLETNWPQISQALTTWSENFWQWAEDATAEIGRVMGRLLAELSSWVNSPEAQTGLYHLGEQVGVILYDALAIGLGNQEKANSAVARLLGTLLQAAVSAGDDLLLIGGQFVAGIFTGILNGITGSDYRAATVNEFRELAQDIADTLIEFGWADVGAAIMVELIEGMTGVDLGNLTPAIGDALENSARLLPGVGGGIGVAQSAGDLIDLFSQFWPSQEQQAADSEAVQQQAETLDEINKKLEGQAVLMINKEKLRDMGFVTVDDFDEAYQ